MSKRWQVVWCVVLGLAAACDPVQDDAIAALGGETPGVHPGPNHRPGQPCLLCHDGALGNPPKFVVAGTVFLDPTGLQPVRGAVVDLRDDSGSTITVQTNRAGNFYLSERRWKPVFPMQVAVRFDGETTTMHSLVGRDGSCAGCHRDPVGPDSPGHVYVRLDDGGVPP